MESLNKSLDDLIAEQKTKQEKQQARRGKKPDEGARPPPRRTSGGQGPRDGPRGGPRSGNLSITVRNAGGVAKPKRAERVDRQDPQTRLAALEGHNKWGHDMFDGRRDGGGGAGARGRRGPRDPTALGTKLFIENLDFNVSDDDIKELFETCGALVKHGVVYDNSGRSEGQAEVIFESPADAERAMRRYNNVQLDGKPMQITLVAKAEGGPSGGGGSMLSSGIRITGNTRPTGRVIQVTRAFEQATGGGAGGGGGGARGRGVVRGRGAVRSGVTAMDRD